MGSPFQRSQNISPTPEESAPKIRHNIMIPRVCGQGYSPPGKQEAEVDSERTEARPISQEHVPCGLPSPAKPFFLKFPDLPKIAPLDETQPFIQEPWREHFIIKP